MTLFASATIKAICASRGALLAVMLGLFAIGGGASAQSADRKTLSDLSLIEVPSTQPHSKTFAVFLSGDGGWAKLDRVVAGEIANSGMPVVGVNTRAFLSRARTPEELSSAVDRIIAFYLREWSMDSVVLFGYSRGAGFVPFAISGSRPELRKIILAGVMISPESGVGFSMHFIDLFRDVKRPTDLSVLAETEKISGMKLICVDGIEDGDSLCPKAPEGLFRVVALQGGHHFNGDYKQLARAILGALN